MTPWMFSCTFFSRLACSPSSFGKLFTFQGCVAYGSVRLAAPWEARPDNARVEVGAVKHLDGLLTALDDAPECLFKALGTWRFCL